MEWLLSDSPLDGASSHEHVYSLQYETVEEEQEDRLQPLYHKLPPASARANTDLYLN